MMTHYINMKEVLCMFKTTVIKCLSLNYGSFNVNMTLFEMSLSWKLDISKTTQPVINMSYKWHSRLIIKLKKALSFMGKHYIELSGGWFWHWLSWGHYKILMTNSVCTTSWVQEKYSRQSYNGIMTANGITNYRTV